jgi:3-dehydroquinate dehydratase/shikimate dehydrogenase
MTYLAVAIAAQDTEAALTAMDRAATLADLAELRLDLMESFDLLPLLIQRPLPVIVTCRPQREGGRWQGSEARRLDVLREAAALGADFVDLEWDVATEAASLDRSRTRLILSRHDHEAMPDLAAQAAQLQAAGADVVKVVGTARGLADGVPVLRLLEAASSPTVAIAMGASGLLTRLVAFRYPSAFLSFAAWDGRGTAPGQITACAMRDVFRVHAMTGETLFVGLLAPGANASPWLARGNAWLAAQGCNAVLVPLEPGPVQTPLASVDCLREVLALRGCLVDPSYGPADLCFASGESRTPSPTDDLADRLRFALG